MVFPTVEDNFDGFYFGTYRLLDPAMVLVIFVNHGNQNAAMYLLFWLR